MSLPDGWQQRGLTTVRLVHMEHKVMSQLTFPPHTKAPVQSHNISARSRISTKNLCGPSPGTLQCNFLSTWKQSFLCATNGQLNFCRIQRIQRIRSKVMEPSSGKKTSMGYQRNCSSSNTNLLVELWVSLSGIDKFFCWRWFQSNLRLQRCWVLGYKVAQNTGDSNEILGTRN